MMKEITRIHIAKISYDIEIPAKKKLETYIEDLSLYAEDDNVLEDIEIRITELLAERGIIANGVIGVDDVDALRATLGEPKHFSGEGDIAVGDDPRDENAQPKRKLYRDIDGAVVGGVLSGMAHYFKVNPLWMRLAFIAILFMSFGFALIVYAVFWLAIPAAQSVTEKLQMRGELVTLPSIRKYNESHEGAVTTKERVQMRRKGFGIFVGILGILIALGALAMTVAGVFGWNIYMTQDQMFESYRLVFILFVASGVLLTLLGAVVSYAGFKTKVTKQIVIVGVAIIVAGVAAASAAIAIGTYEAWEKSVAVQESIKERSITLPNDFSTITSLAATADNALIEYRVSDETRATVTAIPGTKVEVTQQSGEAKVTVKSEQKDAFYASRPLVVIYGPSLSKIIAENGASLMYAAKTQELTAVAVNAGNISLSGNYTRVSFDTHEGTIDAEGASITSVSAVMKTGGSILLGNVESLVVTQPTACPNYQKASLTVRDIAMNELTYNGKQLPKASHSTACGEVNISLDEETPGY